MSPAQEMMFYAVVQEGDTRRAARILMNLQLQQDLGALFRAQADALIGMEIKRLAYQPGYSPGDDEAHVLEKFPLPQWLAAIVTAPDAPAPLTEKEIAGRAIKALLGVQPPVSAKALLLFQSFDATQIIEPGGFTLLLSKGTFNRVSTSGIAIGTKVGAAIEKGDLVFRSETVVRRFLDVDAFFKEATDEEIGAFLHDRHLSVAEPGRVVAAADRWVRTKITAITRGKVLSRVALSEIARVGRAFGVSVESKGGKLVVPSQKAQLKSLLRLLDDDLLYSTLTKSRYLVNSKRKLGNGRS